LGVRFAIGKEHFASAAGRLEDASPADDPSAVAAEALLDQLLAVAGGHVHDGDPCATCEAIRGALALSVALMWRTDP
jgi:hypothetical protein